MATRPYKGKFLWLNPIGTCCTLRFRNPPVKPEFADAAYGLLKPAELLSVSYTTLELNRRAQRCRLERLFGGKLQFCAINPRSTGKRIREVDSLALH